MPRRRLIALVGVWVVALCAVSAICAVHAYDSTTHSLSDWIIFEVGARTLVHYHHTTTNLYDTPRLHVYVDNPDIQIGPPALWFVAAFEGLRVRTVYGLFSVIMAVIGLAGVFAAIITGRREAWRGWERGGKVALIVAASLLAAAFIAEEANRWKHLDDLMAVTLACVSAYLISRRRAWWLIGLLLGTGVAAKPWALILAPILLALPRRDIARATLVTVGVAAAWWAPFVIAAPGTVQALGHWQIIPDPGSVLRLVGIQGDVSRWLRPVQFFLGLGMCAYVCRNRPWVSAPLAALATRVLTDPYAFGYYSLGPLTFALLYDCAGGGWQGLPTWTALTALLDVGLSNIVPHLGIDSPMHQQTVLAVAKLLWAVSVLAAVLAPTRFNRGRSEVTDKLAEPSAGALSEAARA
ncbi:MAG TPA: hypothetical protein VG650_00455 [Mycobacteriales bacterium]|nr:hypothetical protein [Mycobacteriales bacterium]